MLNKKRENFYIDGVGEINSIEEMAEKSGQSLEFILFQRGKGATDEDIYNGTTINFNCYDKKYYSVKEFKKAFGLKIGSSAIIYRLKRGASLEELVEQSKGNGDPKYHLKLKKGHSIILEEVEYESLTKAFDAYKDDPRVEAPFGTIKQRVCEYGWTPEQAFLTERGGDKESISLSLSY